MAAVLVLGSAAGGTVAWLITRTDPLVNVFTYGDINIEIAESDSGDGDANPYTNTYMMMPGAIIPKDPTVTVLAGSQNAWLFVKLDKSANFDSFMTYTVAEGWTALPGAAGVYYRAVSQQDEPQAFGVLADNAVAVRAEVTAAMLNALTPETRPTLTVTAYAVQRSEDIEALNTAERAWALADPAAQP